MEVSPASFKKMPWFCKKSVLISEKSFLFMCVYGLNSHLKCSILEKRKPNFSPVGSFFCMSYMKRLSKWPYSKKSPLPRKIVGCATTRIRENWRRKKFLSMKLKPVVRFKFMLPRILLYFVVENNMLLCRGHSMRESLKQQCFTRWDLTPGFLWNILISN